MNDTRRVSEGCIKINRKRKPRIVKNADVDIDNVLESPGPNYSTWISITKQKLKERETRIMKRRITVVQSIISEEIESFENIIIKKHTPNISLNSSMYDNIMHENYDMFIASLTKLNQYIDTWTGPHLIHMRRKLNTFRDYFRVGKSWFDQRKKQLLATEFWIDAFALVFKMNNKLSQCFADVSLRNKFQKALSSKIFLRLFQAEWTFPATKPLLLIPASCIKKSNRFKNFVLTNVMEIDEKQFKNTNVSAKELGKKLVKQLIKISCENVKQFELNLILLNSDQKENKYDNNSNNGGNAFDDCNETLHAEGVIIDLGIPTPIYGPISMGLLGYKGFHKSAYSVCSKRFGLFDC